VTDGGALIHSEGAERDALPTALGSIGDFFSRPAADVRQALGVSAGDIVFVARRKFPAEVRTGFDPVVIDRRTKKLTIITHFPPSVCRAGRRRWAGSGSD
jgi:hypothetical protein